MNIQEYIQSGIIESYVMGMANAEEAKELDTMRAQYPEVEQAIRDFEKVLESTHRQHAVQPSSEIKKAVFRSLNIEQPVREKQSVGSKASIRYMAAASVILLALSGALNVYMYSKYQKLQSENNQLSIQQTQLFVTNDALQTKMRELDAGMRLITGDEMARIRLTGVQGKAGNEAIVYWNKNTREVYISVKKLPAPPPGTQYQLWALLDGKPIDAGVLNDCGTICKLNNIAKAQAFAITLEKAGGNPTPTLSQLYVMGNI
jgi:anti-sigma-K factor RskA